MTIKITIAPLVTFAVKGEVLDEQGVSQAFDFSLRARRLDADEQAKRFAPDSRELVLDLLCDIVEAWDGVIDDAAALIPFKPAALRQLCKQYPGLPQLVIECYLDSIRVKRKN